MEIRETLRIDEEFEKLVPPLTDEEYRQLEENIVLEGTVLMPLMVWNGTVIDGHNRYKIIRKHPDVSNIMDMQKSAWQEKSDA